MKCKTLCLLLAISFTNTALIAQHGYSTASVAMNRANGVLHPNEVVVEEYLNYHTHRIAMPKHGEDVALSMAYGHISESSVMLQVGIATDALLDYSELPPVNVSLVIDHSGSMGSDNKLEKVKLALSNFIRGLRPEDRVSVVVYESSATVMLESQLVGDIRNLDNVINSIRSGGSTNLYDGLMMGYEQVLNHFDSHHTNKVILLTDGIANVGITNTEKIIEASAKYNNKGIDVATIGVGYNLNYSLLQEISREGRGDNHFVGNAEEDIVKVFQQELEGLLSQVGKQVYLELTYAKGLSLAHIYGYEPEFGTNSVRIPLNNINRGLTQVLLFEFVKMQSAANPSVTAHLTYTDAKDVENQITITEEANFSKNPSRIPNELRKNLCIANMATALRSMATEVEQDDIALGLLILDEALTEVEVAFPYLKDEDILRIKNILDDNYQNLYAFYSAYNAPRQDNWFPW